MTLSSELRAFNRWRRGDESLSMPDPKRLGEVIAQAATELERLQAIEKAARNLIAKKRSANLQEAYERLTKVLGKKKP